MKRWIKISLLLVVILINVFLAYQPRVDYTYPLVGDEYVHISFAQYILKEHQLPFINPYISPPEPHANFEMGFHIFLAGIFSVIKADPIVYYQYFVIIFAIINGLLLFHFTRLLTKKYIPSLAATIFFGTIGSAGGFFAHQYFLPLSLGVTLLFLSFIFFYRYEESGLKRHFLFLIVTLCATALTYPPALFFFLGIAFFYTTFIKNFLHEKFNVTRKRFLAYVVGVSVALSALFIATLKYLGLLDKIIFPVGWSAVQLNLSPIFFFGIIPSIFAIAGVISIFYTQRAKIMLIWLLFSIALLYFFYVLQVIYFIPFERLFLFYLIGISILAGLGFLFLIEKSNHNRWFEKWGGKTAVIAILVLLVGFRVFLSLSRDFQPAKILDDNTYAALKFLGERYPDGSMLIADNLTSIAAYPVSRSRVIGIIDSNIGGGDTAAANVFLAGNCEKKKEVAKKIFYSTLNPDFNSLSKSPLLVISDERQEECGFLENIYDKGPYLYELSLLGKFEARYGNACKNCGVMPNGAPLDADWWYFDITLRETGNILGITVNTMQSCYVDSRSSNFCNPVKPISNANGAVRIPAGGRVTWSAAGWRWKRPSDPASTRTDTYRGVDDNGNNIEARYSFSVGDTD